MLFTWISDIHTEVVYIDCNGLTITQGANTMTTDHQIAVMEASDYRAEQAMHTGRPVGR